MRDNTDKSCIEEPILYGLSLSVEVLLVGKWKVKNSVNSRKVYTVCIEVIGILLVRGPEVLNLEFSYWPGNDSSAD